MIELSKSEINKNIDSFFSSSRDYLGESFLELLDSLSVNYSTQPSRLPLKSLISVFNSLNVTLDSVVARKVDFKAIKAQMQSKDILPDRYTGLAPLSSRFTGSYMLDYIEKNFGKRYAELVMQRHQLTKCQFADHKLKNNILLSIDLTQYLYDFQNSDAVEAMGANSAALLAKNSLIINSQENQKSCQSMFEWFFEQFAPDHVEKNYLWQIEKSSSNYICISGKPRIEIIETFDKKSLSSRPMEHLRKGFLQGLPTVFGSYIAQCHQIQSISLGDDQDRYEISYYPKNHLLNLTIQ